MKLSRLFKYPLYLIVLLFLMLAISAFSYDENSHQNTKDKHWYDDAVIYCLENRLLLDHLQSDTLQEPVTWFILAQTLSDTAANYSENLYISRGNSSAPVNWAKDFSIMESTLSENDIVTRLDIAVALSSFFGKSNVDAPPPLSTSCFSDFSSIPDNCKNSVLFVESSLLMNGYGDGTFGGNDSLRICQLAQILYNGRDIFSDVVMDKLFSLDEDQIAYIEFQDGDTGNKDIITERTTLSSIIQLLNSFKVSSIQRVESEGWSYRIKLHFTSETEVDFYISPDSVTIHNVKYTSTIQHFSSIL